MSGWSSSATTEIAAMTLEQAVEQLTKGIRIDGYDIYIRKVHQGRFHEEQNLQVNLHNQEFDLQLFQAKVFYGRLPAYRPWVELFNIEAKINLTRSTIDYFDSDFENTAIEHFTRSLEPGARIFVEYYNDQETRRQLAAGIPVVLSRLGLKLFRCGCTWFKDWYFPEGYMEGNQKLQGETPLNEQAQERHLKAISDEVNEFMKKQSTQHNSDDYTRRALDRAEAVFSGL